MTRIQLIPILIVIVLSPLQADEVKRLERIVVTPTRTMLTETSTPASVRVITREQIEASGARQVAQVLRGLGGIQVTDTFGDGSRALVGMRGFGENAGSNTLILMDGRRLNNADIAAPDLNSISLKDVERIEIIQGSAGVMYGDQAVGGVVNIITRTPQQFHAEVEGGAGSYDAKQARAIVSQRLDNGFAYRITAEHRESDNYRDHNDLDYRNYFSWLGYHYREGLVFFEFQKIDEDLELPGALFKPEVEQERRQSASDFRQDFSNTDTKVKRAGIRHGLNAHVAFEGEITERESNTKFRLSFRGFMSEPSTQDRDIREFTPRVILTYPNSYADMLFTLGYDRQSSDYELRSQLGVQGNDQELKALYAQAVLPVSDSVTITTGVRDAEVENDIDNRPAFVFGPIVEGAIDDQETVKEFGVVLRPGPNWRVFARYDQNLRFAKVDELTNTLNGQILKTQTGDSYEFGGEWASDKHYVMLNIYRLDLDDEISFDPITFTNLNLDRTRRDGLIVESTSKLGDNLSVSTAYSYVDAKLRSGPFDGNDIPLVARNILRVSADYQINIGLNL